MQYSRSPTPSAAWHNIRNRAPSRRPDELISTTADIEGRRRDILPRLETEIVDRIEHWGLLTPESESPTSMPNDPETSAIRVPTTMSNRQNAGTPESRISTIRPIEGHENLRNEIPESFRNSVRFDPKQQPVSHEGSPVSITENSLQHPRRRQWGSQRGSTQ